MDGMVATMRVDTTDHNNATPSHQPLTPHNASLKINSIIFNNLLQAKYYGHRNTAFTSLLTPT
jgi:hypothetical protein